MRIISMLLFVLFCYVVNAQKFTISGTITDAGNGEALIGANIYVTNQAVGSTTNSYGFYSMTLPSADSIWIAFTYVGFQSQLKLIQLSRNIHLDIEMEPNTISLEEVVVTKDQHEHVNRPQIGRSIYSFSG